MISIVIYLFQLRSWQIMAPNNLKKKIYMYYSSAACNNIAKTKRYQKYFTVLASIFYF